MTDYKNLKLIATSSPHIRGSERTQTIMLDVIIAMLPALIFACFHFGLRALCLTAVSVAGCMFFEWLYQRVMKKPSSVMDLSSVVTGMLLSFVCPVQMPYWMILIGDAFAIIIVKQLFGGIGKNFVNPALAGRAVLLASYAGTMTSWVDPAVNKAAAFGSNVDITTAATPLSYMKGPDAASIAASFDQLKGTDPAALAESFGNLTSTYSVQQMFMGQIGGSLGEVSSLMLIIGGVYLIARKVINWHTPVAYIGTVAVLTFLFPKAGTSMEWMLYSIFGGGLMLGAFFMATDYATSPVTKKGQLIFGVGCGLFTVLIRYFGSYNEGVCYSIMVMNLFVALIDKYTKPVRFGVVKKEESGK